MECNVMKDLLPLYMDGCCSDESAKLVEEHMENCPDCKALYEKNRGSNARKAATLHKVLLVVSIAIILCGAFGEIFPGLVVGFSISFLTMPAVAFLLSLINWFFIGRYKSKKSFVNSSLFITIGVTVCAYIGTGIFYGIAASETLFLLVLLFFCFGYLADFILAIAFILLSRPLANKYAELRGKK